jgi:hypothetical protein
MCVNAAYTRLTTGLRAQMRSQNSSQTTQAAASQVDCQDMPGT